MAKPTLYVGQHLTVVKGSKKWCKASTLTVKSLNPLTVGAPRASTIVTDLELEVTEVRGSGCFNLLLQTGETFATVYITEW